MKGSRAVRSDQHTSPSAGDRDIVLDVHDLSIAYETGRGDLTAVDHVSFQIARGETFGLAGESGSGKSTIANAILGLLGDAGRVVSGNIRCENVQVADLSGEALRMFRWNEVSMVFQSAMNALNPVMTVSAQIVDVLTTHTGRSRRESQARALELLDLVGIDATRAGAYPHQLSGGMRQRAVIAIALALEPTLLIMDEPTTALDVVVQQEIIQEIKDLQARLGFAILFITHDLSLMVEISHRIGVMRNGRLVESGDAKQVYTRPAHAYTRQLIEAFPAVGQPTAAEPRPAATASTPSEPPVVRLCQLSKVFRVGGFRRRDVVAVRDVDLDLARGEILALVGESGSGKSTVAKMLARLEQPTSGSILLDGKDVLAQEGRRASLRYRSDIQMVFQDPFGSLNPAHHISHFLERPLILHRHDLDAAGRREEVESLLRSVELDAELLERFPHELSGGQRQRIAIARALAAGPRVILADEPTSMLDVSVRMGVLNLMKGLRDSRGISILYITHDLAAARYLADTTVVMLRGSLVEGGRSNEIMDDPRHPYTRLLVSAAPDPLREASYDRAERSAARLAIDELVRRRSDTPPGAAPRERTFLSGTHWVDRLDLDVGPATD
ncbi:dipeptide ABC transporter ATP-binding protein [Propionicimonas sp.]|uniref:dipeptide ABC transporter ATP-binding protein n=1 Tax=Propionicimonas sp. TaxID=1955623 RepID=UPI0039E60492